MVKVPAFVEMQGVNKVADARLKADRSGLSLAAHTSRKGRPRNKLALSAHGSIDSLPAPSCFGLNFGLH
jgi:hypothetical protein